MTEEYAGPRKPCDLVHGGDECAAVDEGYWGDDEEEIAFVKRWNCDPKTLGAYGEDLACELLKRNDYIILERTGRALQARPISSLSMTGVWCLSR